ncbi:MAG: UDP-N-acetylglucosamine 2-epimerase [Methanosarcina sp.]
MSNVENLLTEKEFKKIFSNENIYNLLRQNIVSYPLIYYFMRYFLSWRVYIQNISSCKETISHTKSLNIILFMLKSLLKNIENSNKDLDILFISRNRFFKLKVSDSKDYKSDYLFGNVIRCMKDKYPMYKTLFISTSPEKMPVIDDINLYSVFEYANIITFIKSFFLSAYFFIQWQLRSFFILNFLDKNNFNYMMPLFRKFFSFGNLFYTIFSDNCLQNILKDKKPRLIVANDDIMFLKPQSDFSTKLIIMQSAYIEKDFEKFKKLYISNFVSDKYKPEFFLVTGQKYFNIKKDTYDSKKIVVVGQPRYDLLYHADKIYKKENFFKKYNIDPAHKVILWTTQCHNMTNEENVKNIKAIFRSIETIKNVTLVIKQHPDESIIHTNRMIEYLNKYRINAMILPTDSDIYEQLYVCDLMITKNSTTAIEALALGKPILVLNLSSEPDIIDYVEKKVALGVYREEDLEISIRKLLNNDIKLEKDREYYIYDSLYKIDGLSSNRVLQIIENVLEYS